ncbi:MAG: DUF2163 domain-containing protein [Alphaproteobacteria bacterium]
MRDIPAELAARLASGVTTLAHVWRIERRDGAVFGFTDHDEPLVFDALTCEPATGLTAGAVEKSLGLAVDTAGVTGALSSDAITEDDLARGLWDGARVDLYQVDWTDTTLSVHLFAGCIGEAKRGAQAFEAELRGLQAPLNVPVGRVFSRFCDADLGDARCSIDFTDALYRGEGVVSEVISGAVFAASGIESFTDGWFSRGHVEWSGGGTSEIATHRVETGGTVIELLDAPGSALTLGADFTIFAGCDKRFETCRAKFSNTLNFRGFPHMPGDDAVIAGPVAGDPLDGSSRFT